VRKSALFSLLAFPFGVIVTRVSTLAVEEQGFILGGLALAGVVDLAVFARAAGVTSFVTSPGLGTVVGVKSCEHNVLHLLCCQDMA
jgi:hypothetical protein